MSFLKHHLSLLVPLIAFLFSYQFYVTLDRTVTQYEQKISGDYSIIIAAESEIDLQKVSAISPIIDEISEVRADTMLEKIKEEISPANFALLKVSLPKFYKISLNRFPDDTQLAQIGETLKKFPKVKRVETFAKTHNRIYQLLSIINSVSQIFAGAFLIIAFLLMTKQVEVWRYEHQERMKIMALFGSPYWMRSAVLFKLALVDSLISTILVLYAFYWFSNHSTITELVQGIGLYSVSYDILQDGPILLGIALGISLISVFVVVSRQKEKLYD